MASSDGGAVEKVLDVFPGVTEPFGNRPEPLQKDPVTWTETLAPELESYLLIQVQDDRVFAIRAPRQDARRSEDHLKRCVNCAQIEGQLDKGVQWKKVARNLKREPKSASKNTSVRHFYRAEGHMFLVKYGFTFGLRHVEAGTQHVYQMSQVPLLCFHLPTKYQHRADLRRRVFKTEDKRLYDTLVFRPHKNYVISAGTYYLVLAIQKTIFSVQVIPDTVQLSPAHFLPFTSHKERESMYTIPPQTPRHSPQDERVTPSVSGESTRGQHDWNSYVIPKKTTVPPHVSPHQMSESTEAIPNAEGSDSGGNTLQQYVNSSEVQDMLWTCSSTGEEVTPAITTMDYEFIMTSPPEKSIQEIISFLQAPREEVQQVQNGSVNCFSTLELPVEEPPLIAEKSSPSFEIPFVTTPLSVDLDMLASSTLLQNPHEEMQSSTEATAQKSWPFKTDFVNSPWTMTPQPLVLPPLLSPSKSDQKPSNAHAVEATHMDHLSHISKNLIHNKGAAHETCERPVDLRVHCHA